MNKLRIPKSLIWSFVIAALVLLAALAWIFIPRGPQPLPASFACLTPDAGDFQPMIPMGRIFGAGLTYASHIKETGADLDSSGPPLFRKEVRSVTSNDSIVPIPEVGSVYMQLDILEPGLSNRLRTEADGFPLLPDYEAELAMVLLEDPDPVKFANADYMPATGFFIANDITSRSVAILGEGQPNKLDYWSLAKSFPGFLPVSARMWVPSRPAANAIPCITLHTEINGQIRQNAPISDIIYTPGQLLRSLIQTYPDHSLRKGDVLLTGTPGGVAIQIPQYLTRLGRLLNLDRFRRLATLRRRDQIRFLKSGDKVTTSGQWLGSVSVEIAQ